MSRQLRDDAPAWPPVGALLRVLGNGSHPWLGPDGRASRVEDVDGAMIAIAAPRGTGDVEPPAVGEELRLRWAGPRGLLTLDVRLVDLGRDGVPLWWCEPAGGLQVHQRREFVRAPVPGGWRVSVAITPVGSSASPVQGHLLDVSEGGLRVRVPAWPGAGGTPVLVHLVLPPQAEEDMDGGRAAGAVAAHELSGTALRDTGVGDPRLPAGPVEVSVGLEQPVPCADDLRSLVFAWQRAERRAGQTRAG